MSQPTLRRYLGALAAGAPPDQALHAALSPLAQDPWRLVQEGGLLARCPVVPAPGDMLLDLKLSPASPGRVGEPVAQGQPVPLVDPQRRKALGAWDTGQEMARALVASCFAATGRAPTLVLDPACGVGALLLAARELGAQDLVGEDLDPMALVVAALVLPGAKLQQRSLWEPGPQAEWVLCNPPFVRPERQDRALRQVLSARWPWLSGRFDLSVPALVAARERVAPGGLAGFITPAPLLTQPYGAPLRRLWLSHDQLLALASPEPFRTAGVQVHRLVLRPGAGPAPLCWPEAPSPQALLAQGGATLDVALRAEDLALTAQMRARGPSLGSLFRVDTGLVAHGPDGGKARLLSAQPAPDRVPFVDARDISQGTRRYLRYSPERMHRPKDKALFEGDKLLVQRLRGERTLRVWVDREGLYAGHTLNVVVPREPLSDPRALDRLAEMLRDPLISAWLRVQRGRGLDVYPHDIADIPLPLSWLNGAQMGLDEAFGLSVEQAWRLRRLGPAEAKGSRYG